MLVVDIGFRSVQEGTVGQISQLVADFYWLRFFVKERFIPMVSA